LDDLLNREIAAPDGERTQFIGHWALGRSVTIATELLWSLFKSQEYKIQYNSGR